MRHEIYFKDTPANIPHLLYTIRKAHETDEAIKGLCDIIEGQNNTINRLCSVIEGLQSAIDNQEGRLSALNETVYRIHPELEVMETMEETENR